jgi:BON domain
MIKHKQLTRYAALIAFLLALGALAGCSQKRDDGQIASDVQNKINADPAIQQKTISASSSNGVVTLAGSVNSDVERTAAGNDAAQVEGVKTVLNNVEVQTAAVPAPEPSPNAGTRSAQSRPRRAAGRSSHSGPVAAMTIPEGTALSVRLIDALDSDHNKAGDSFRATLESPVTVAGRVVIPRDADVEGEVVAAQGGAHFAGRSNLSLTLTRLVIGAKAYEVETDEFTREGAARGKRTAEMIGGGAGLGALVGGLTNGGKGALIGAAAGAGAGTGVQALTHGEQVKLPSESVLQFRLKSPITVEPSAAGRNTSRPRIE